MQLRPYQADDKQRVYNAWDSGSKNVLLVEPTGAGKTVIVSDIIREHRGASCSIAHRSELVTQISLALNRNEVRHRIIGPKNTVKLAVSIHMKECGKSYYSPSAPCAVASVDTLVRRQKELSSWLPTVTKCIIDEGHHVLTDNKWGKAFSMFENAIGLLVTATPLRADGKGLGRHVDGIVDEMVEGPTMRQLINAGYLTDYRILAPPQSLIMSDDDISKTTGDYKRSAVVKKFRNNQTKIIGDIVGHYLKHAEGKLGITFVPDVQDAIETALAYNKAGVPAAAVHSGTPDAERVEILNRFKNRDLLQLVNVDLFGEGFDLPAIEVVSMARPTQSFSLFCLDPDTEILTSEGWKSHDDLNSINEVIAWDMNDGSVISTPVMNRIKRNVYNNESMYGIKSPHLDINVSDNHDMITKGNSITCVNWVKEKAHQTASRKSLFRIPVSGKGLFKGVKLNESELYLLGWFLSDGYINKKTNGLSISQACNKTYHINHIRNTLIGCGLKFGEHIYKRKNVPDTHHNIHVFTVSKGKPRLTNKHLKGWSYLEEWLNKSIPKCYDDLTRDDFKKLLTTLNLGDGVNNHNSLDYIKRTLTITCGDNKKMADRLQAMAVVRGFRCNIATLHYEGYSEWYILHIRDVTTATIAGINVKDGVISGKKQYKRSRFEKLNNKPSFVWCIENKLGTLITRRNGKVAIVGNCQQFGRALRLMISPILAAAWDTFTDAQRLQFISESMKSNAIIIDHVGNVQRHRLPDAHRVWTLDRRDRRSSGQPSDVIPVTSCLNPNCMSVYERIYKACPYCGFKPVPIERSGPEYVDGDLTELDADTLAEMRGEIDRIDDVVRYPSSLAAPARMRLSRVHAERQDAQTALRACMAWWAGWQQSLGRNDTESYRRFYFAFGVDVMTAQTLGAREAFELANKVNEHLGRGVS